MKVGDKVRILDTYAVSLQAQLEDGDVVEISCIEEGEAFFMADGEYWHIPNSPAEAWEIVEESTGDENSRNNPFNVGDTVKFIDDLVFTINAGKIGRVIYVEEENEWVGVEGFGFHHKDLLELVKPSVWGMDEITKESKVSDTNTDYEMTTEEYFQFIDTLNKEMVSLVRRKNADYTSGKGPFANFKVSENFGVDPITGLAVRMGDKMQRLQSYCKQGKLEVEDEGLAEIAYDFIGYSWLLLGMLEERKINE